ncbi:PucR family transcriptional regulator [Streptomyces sp. RPT161]|uniref:PucR family transcriptional regulator n=1 Tax=Streptomyces sp. RPT161 TaxID=3015993 RepID=UPI0022B88415|nr:helix-turn-helix domain-containing protein [Streptomyces sp. RPT161]
MYVEDLLGLESLDLRLLWADHELLTQEITGVTATDLEDPSRFLQRGELVLTGLVWWSPDGGSNKADRFVSALRTNGAAALLAGEETHGFVPAPLVEACRAHRIALLSVPAHTNFRTITDAVYLRRWGDLNRKASNAQALPEPVRRQLADLLAQKAPIGDVLTCSFSHLEGVTCAVVSATGRTLATTPDTAAPNPTAVRSSLTKASAATIPLGSSASPYDALFLRVPELDQAPPRVLAEIADVLGERLADARIAATSQRERADHLVSLISHPIDAPSAITAALTACGLPTHQPTAVVAARVTGAAEGQEAAWAAGALGEALSHMDANTFAVGSARNGEAIAVVTGSTLGDLAEHLHTIWPTLHAIAPQALVHAGIGPTAATPNGLSSSFAQARFALSAAQSAEPTTSALRAAEHMTTLTDLLAGIPTEVRTAFRERLLAPLIAQDEKTDGALMETLEVFLAHDGSWTRSAEALHVHVNTVHYRLQRIEQLTGRDLSRLTDRLDLRAALLCDPSGKRLTPVDQPGRPTSSTKAGRR